MSHTSQATPPGGAAPSELVVREAAEEARVLFECLSALAGDALAAAHLKDHAALRRALDERDRVAEQLGPLVRELGQARQEAPGEAAGDATEREVEAVVSTAIAVQEADAALIARLAQIRMGAAGGDPRP